jgi:prepilin-type N-terminal cleavage/methylation domain-containing protein
MGKATSDMEYKNSDMRQAAVRPSRAAHRRRTSNTASNSDGGFFMSHVACRMSHSRGFTLVELLVAIGLFSILFAIAGGGFVNALRAQRQISAMMAAESNIGIALEEMAREIRTGYLFCHDPITAEGVSKCDVPTDPVYSRHCVLDAQTTWPVCSDLEYYNANSEKVDYVLKNGILERGKNDVYQPITGNNVTVRSLSFVIHGNKEGDQWNPRITITVGVAPNDPSVSWDTVNLETSVSAREIDCTQGGTPSC